jgi:hypothetical protein
VRLWLSAIAVAAALIASVGAVAAGEPETPAGLTAIPKSQSVALSWSAVAGATGYAVYRGTTATSVNTLVSPAGLDTQSFTDSGVQNGTDYFYNVVALSGSAASPHSKAIRSTPVAAGCSGGNPVVQENCYPGATSWHVFHPVAISAGGVEGFATATSIEKGQSLDLKINTAVAAPVDIEIYRTGYYGGYGARLYSIMLGVSSTHQPACSSSPDTGLVDCSNWSSTATVTTTSSWPTGVYIARLVRTDTGGDSHILFVVRDDTRQAKLVYGVPFSTYNAYNNWGGKSLYDFSSSGASTVSGGPRAVKVSFDRPFAQARDTSGFMDWYTLTDFATVSWLERSGYDVDYVSSVDLVTDGASLSNHSAFMLGAHDEYYSAAMRSALEQARAAGVSLFNAGANSVYWKVRFENGPGGAANRIEVCYKTSAGGPVDPSGVPTTTWRDPAGPNDPENALLGGMYTGDQAATYFPLTVTTAEGADRAYRYTGLDSGGPTSIGVGIVGWEWDSRFDNGHEPSGLVTLASTPVQGNIVQPDGSYATGPAVAMATKYTAASGALVFSSGTNRWSTGLGLNGVGSGEPNTRIQQATTNILADMHVLPETPAAGMSFDSPPPPGAPGGVDAHSTSYADATITWGAVSGAETYDVYRTTSPRTNGAPLGAKVNSSPLTGTSFHDSGLAPATTYYYVVTATRGVASQPSAEASATTDPLPPFVVTTTAPVSGGSGFVSAVSATFSRPVAAASVSGSSLVVHASDGTPVAGSVSLAAPSNTVSFVPAQPLAAGSYSATVSGVAAPDGTVAASKTWSFTATGCPCSLFSDAASPASQPSGTYELGVRFTVDVTSSLTALRFFKALGESGSHVGSLWTASGVRLAQVTFSGESSSGWQVQQLPSAVSLQPGTVYVVSVNANWAFAQTISGLSSSVVSGPLRTVADGANGVYSTTRGSFPDQSWGSSNYYVDPVVRVGTLPFDVSSTAPASGGSGFVSAVSATFSRAVAAGSVSGASLVVHASDGTSVAGSVSLDASSDTVSFTPAQPLVAGSYSATVSGVAAPDGTVAASKTWSFTATGCPCSLFSASASPASQPSGTYELGVRFTVDVASSLTSLRYYKASGESGTHVGSVWTASGARLAQVTFAGESSSGWQVQQLPSAVSLQPGTVYIVSVNANYAFAQTIGGLSSQVVSGPLRTVADGANGVYSTTRGSFPDQTWGSSNYYVDMILQAGAVPFTVTNTSPGSGDSGFVSTVSATFSRSVAASSVSGSSLVVRGSGGTQVAGSVSLDAGSNTVSFAAAQPLAAGSYSATLSGVAAPDGTVAASKTWSFTATGCPCSLFSTAQAPASQPSGTYELGVRLTVDTPLSLTSLRYYKASGESGTHVGSVWTASGVRLAQVTFSGESSSGWQVQQLPSALSLQPGTVYVVSVNANYAFAQTIGGLSSQVVSGPLRTVADGVNGVFSTTRGSFPDQTWGASNYYVDVITATP